MGSTDRDAARWALREDRKLSKIAKLVWYSLDSRGPDPYPSVGTLAADCGTGTTRNTVKRGLAELEASGWLRIIPRTSDDGGATSHRYVLTCPFDVSAAQRGVGSSQTRGGGSVMDRGVGPSQTGGGSAVDPEDQQEDQSEDQQAEVKPASLGSPSSDPVETANAGSIAAQLEPPPDPDAWQEPWIARELGVDDIYDLDGDELRTVLGMLSQAPAVEPIVVVNTIKKHRREGL